MVEADRLLGADRVRTGDAVVALGSSGLHSNGYSLVRRVLLEQAGWALDRDVAELGRPLGDELLEPTRIYAKDCLALAAAVEVHAMSHVTGGGLAANLARVLPPGTGAEIDRATWRPQPVFDLVARTGGIEQAELERTLNMGVGMVAVVCRRRRRRGRDLAHGPGRAGLGLRPGHGRSGGRGAAARHPRVSRPVSRSDHYLTNLAARCADSRRGRVPLPYDMK